jgi:acyl-CoA synthetase (NDP forming)
VTDVQELIASVTGAADAAGLHAQAPIMLLELQSLVGALSAAALESTEHGRRPFRTSGAFESALGAVGFALFNLADQSGIDLPAAIADHAGQTRAAAEAAKDAEPPSWPFTD